VSAALAQITVVTGGGGGLGLACAAQLGRSSPILLADRSSESLDRAVASLRQAGVEAHSMVTDVTDAAQVHELAAQAALGGRMSALVHTAGVWDVTTSGREIFEINYGGTVNVLDAFQSLATENTTAVCLSSIGAHRQAGMDRLDRVLTKSRGAGLWDALSNDFAGITDPVVAYAAAKRGIIIECEVRSAQWAARGARLLSISPGNFDTPMGRQGQQSGAANHAVDNAIGRRPGAPAELAEIVAFLTSPAAAYITGCDLRVDGGAVAKLRHSLELQEAFAEWDGAVARSASFAEE
jgi:NAD(P)-dependent dehydrogenase (short-subunit alcohol dehydrogenase family)